MQQVTLDAQPGRPTGTRPSRRLRAEGKVPGVVYGLDREPLAVAVDRRELRAALTTEAGLNALINLRVGDSTELTIVKEIQRHPIRRDILHVDFQRVSARQEITVEVPIHLTGEAEEVERAGGIVEQLLHSLTVNTTPVNIPNELTVDISGLTLDAPVRVADIALPEGVTTDVDPEEPVVIASLPSAVLAEEGAAEAEGAGEAEVAPGADTGEEPPGGDATDEG